MAILIKLNQVIKIIINAVLLIDKHNMFLYQLDIRDHMYSNTTWILSSLYIMYFDNFLYIILIVFSCINVCNSILHLNRMPPPYLLLNVANQIFTSRNIAKHVCSAHSSVSALLTGIT